jgi:tetratricopeptide (TPR) repeat protein
LTPPAPVEAAPPAPAPVEAPPAPPPAAPPTAPLPARKRNLKPLLFIGLGLLGVLLLAGAITGGIVYWINKGKEAYNKSTQVYQAGDCAAAIPLYAPVARYPDWAGDFAKQGKAELAECTAFEQAAEPAKSQDWEGSIAATRQFFTNYPNSPSTELGHTRIKEWHAQWAENLFKTGSYEKSIEVYDALVTSYPDLKVTSEEKARDSYLAWGTQLLKDKKYEDALAIYDKMDLRGSPFADVTLDPRNQVYLDWGAALTAEAKYSEAETVLLTLLKLESDRLAPMDLSALEWDTAWPWLYSLTSISETLSGTLRTGPGETYPTLMYITDFKDQLYPVLGADSSQGWYAVALGTKLKANKLGQNGLDTIPWTKQVITPVAWIPAENLVPVLAGQYAIPYAAPFMQQLADQSPAAAQGLETLLAVYNGWSDASLAAASYQEAGDLAVKAASLTTGYTDKEAAWEKVANVNLAEAEAKAQAGEYEASSEIALTAQIYAPESLTAQKARLLHIDNWMALAAAAVTAQAWQTGLDDYNQAIALEEELPAEPVVEGYTPRTPTARLKIAELYLAWGQDLHAAGKYEEAIEKYDIVMADDELNTLAPGANVLAAASWKALGDIQLKGSQPGQAALLYIKVLDLAPDSTSAAEVKTTLTGLIPSVVEGGAAGGGCDEVYIIDALLKAKLTTAEVDALIPQALYQCGEEAFAAGRMAEARSCFERVLNTYPDSPYKANVDAAMPRLAWGEKVKAKGLSGAASALCASAKKTVQASYTTIGTPPNIYISGAGWMSSLPTGWKGEELFTNTVVCVSTVEKRVVEVCKYYLRLYYLLIHMFDITRYRYVYSVRIVNAYTGLTVAVGELAGSTPAACPYSAPSSIAKEIYGSQPGGTELLAWLKQYFKVPAQ